MSKISVKIDQDHYDRLREVSKRTGASVAWQIRKALDIYFIQVVEFKKERKHAKSQSPAPARS